MKTCLIISVVFNVIMLALFVYYSEHRVKIVEKSHKGIDYIEITENGLPEAYINANSLVEYKNKVDED